MLGLFCRGKKHVNTRLIIMNSVVKECLEVGSSDKNQSIR